MWIQIVPETGVHSIWNLFQRHVHLSPELSPSGNHEAQIVMAEVRTIEIGDVLDHRFVHIVPMPMYGAESHAKRLDPGSGTITLPGVCSSVSACAERCLDLTHRLRLMPGTDRHVAGDRRILGHGDPQRAIFIQVDVSLADLDTLALFH